MAKCEYFKGRVCGQKLKECMIYKQFDAAANESIERGTQEEDLPHLGERTHTLARKYNCPRIGEIGDAVLERFEETRQAPSQKY